MVRERLRAIPMLLLGLCLGVCLERNFVALWSPRGDFTGSQSRPSSPTRHARCRLGQTARSATLVGNEAPLYHGNSKFKAIVDEDIESMSLREFANGGYTVLFFYPLDFTFVCPTEIIAFSDRFEEFKSRNTQVLGVSVDSEFSHLAWIQMSRDEGGLGGLEYPLISDFHRELAKSYGILSPDGVAYRALFIIDKEGVVQHATVNNMAFGRNVDEVLRVLDAWKKYLDDFNCISHYLNYVFLVFSESRWFCLCLIFLIDSLNPLIILGDLFDYVLFFWGSCNDVAPTRDGRFLSLSTSINQSNGVKSASGFWILDFLCVSLDDFGCGAPFTTSTFQGCHSIRSGKP